MSEGPSIDPSAEAQMDQANQRLLWTGAAANGALILALIGFAGNADDPVAALRTVTIPALCGITGFTFGGTAISYALAHLAQRPLESIARAKIAMAHRQNEAFKDVLHTRDGPGLRATGVGRSGRSSDASSDLRPAGGSKGPDGKEPGTVRGSDAGLESFICRRDRPHARGAAVVGRLVRGGGARCRVADRAGVDRPCAGSGQGGTAGGDRPDGVAQSHLASGPSRDRSRSCGAAGLPWWRASLPATGEDLEGAAAGWHRRRAAPNRRANRIGGAKCGLR